MCFLPSCNITERLSCAASRSLAHLRYLFICLVLKVPKGTLRPDWFCMRVDHWIGLKKDINRYRFFIFYFDLGCLIRVQSSKLLHAKMNATSCLFRSRFACAQTAIFSAKPCCRNEGETSIVLLITTCEQRIPPSCNPNQNNRAALCHQIKVRQPIGRQDSM